MKAEPERKLVVLHKRRNHGILLEQRSQGHRALYKGHEYEVVACKFCQILESHNLTARACRCTAMPPHQPRIASLCLARARRRGSRARGGTHGSAVCETPCAKRWNCECCCVLLCVIGITCRSFPSARNLDEILSFMEPGLGKKFYWLKTDTRTSTRLHIEYPVTQSVVFLVLRPEGGVSCMRLTKPPRFLSLEIENWG